MQKSPELSEHWDYRIVRLGPAEQPVGSGELRIHRCFYSSDKKERILGLEKTPTSVSGKDKKELLRVIDALVDAMDKGILRSAEIYD